MRIIRSADDFCRQLHLPRITLNLRLIKSYKRKTLRPKPVLRLQVALAPSKIMIILKRAYDRDPDTGPYSILVDRLWPRGLSKETFQPDEWLKDIAPSDKLRKSFGHDPSKWMEFRKKYLLELKGKDDLLQKIKHVEKKKGKVVLLYAARDTEHNNAVVLKEVLEQ